MRNILLRVIILSLFCTHCVWSQDTREAKQGELAQKTQNPVSDLISLPFQNNATFKIAGSREAQNVLNIQPVYPIHLNDDLNVITRTILPLISQPSVLTGDERTAGLGDLNVTAFFSPSNSGKWIWGIGPVASLPSATDQTLGTERWALGASAVLLTIRGPWVIGGLVNNLWDVGGEQERTHMNQMLFQPFVNYNFDDGLYIVSAPIITANWEITDEQKWTLPVGAGVGRVFHAGKMPINASVHYYYNVKHTPTGGTWGLRIQLQFLFPKNQ